MRSPFSIKWIYLIERRSFGQKYKFSNKNDMVSAWRNFKNTFPRPLFIIIFSPEMLKFQPYSILTGQTVFRLVIYCVLSSSVLRIVKLINAGYFVASSLHTIGAQWKIGTLNFLVCWAWIIECFKSKTTCPPAAAPFCRTCAWAANGW